jgi:hypothetical protein
VRNQPLPIGYIEVQRSWIGEKPPDELANMVADTWAQATRENVSLMPYGSRVERALDGAGVAHYTLYAGFVPLIPSSEPLDVRNLNGVERYDQIGDPARDNNIGAKEQKF